MRCDQPEGVSPLAFDRSDAVTFGGVISGSGQVMQIGTGTTILAGANTYTGGTTTSGGTLSVSSDGNLGAAAGALTFNGGTLQNTAAFASARNMTISAGGGTIETLADLTASGVVGGAEALFKTGAGKLELTGNSSGFTGTTSIQAGTLAVNGSLCGDMNVLSGGRLQGIGTVCDTTNFAGGTVAPGNSIGTITVAGNYTGVGGTLEVEAILRGDASPTDLLHVTGNTSGPTNVQVINLGGAGAQAVEGIRIVQVDGVSAGPFSLLGGLGLRGGSGSGRRRLCLPAVPGRYQHSW